MGCGGKCLKVLLIIVNIIFFLAGAAILGVGLWVRLDPAMKNFAAEVEGSGVKEFTDTLYIGAYILIAFGAFTFVVGFCGCCGAMRESKCLLGTYILLVLIVLGAEIGGGVFAYVQKDDLLKLVNEKAGKFFNEKYGKDGSGAAETGWDLAMENLECCGMNGPSDFKVWAKSQQANTYVPDACCVHEGDPKVPKDKIKCQSDAQNQLNKTTEFLNGIGCKDRIEDLIKKNSVLLLGVGAGVAGFELLVVIMAIGFCCTMDKDD